MEVEVPDIRWLSVDKGSLKPRETATLEQTCCVKPKSPHWEGPEDTFLTNPVRLTNERHQHICGDLLCPFPSCQTSGLETLQPLR